MNAADYTDGGGWAKLDQRSADMLAEAVGLFRKKELVERTRMLLTLFRCIANDGTFAVSEQDLADRAGTTKDKASGLFDALEKAGIVIRVNKLKDKTIVRRFSWHNSENPGVSTARNSKNPGKSTARCSKNPGKSTAIKRVQSTQNVGTLCPRGREGRQEPPSRPSDGAGWDESNLDSWMTPPDFGDDFADLFGGDDDG